MSSQRANTTPASRLAVLLCTGLAVLGCARLATPATPGSGGESGQAGLQTNVETLGELINLPHPPQAALWQVDKLGPASGNLRLPGPSDYYLVAVLTYEPAVMRDMQATATAKSSPVQVSEDFFKSWYPQPVRDSFEPSSLRLRAPAYEATAFAKSPWLMGYMFFPSDETLFVCLWTQ